VKPRNAVRLDRTVGRAVYRLHKGLYRLTGGRVGRTTAQGPVVLLTHTGRRSGQRRTTPLLSVADGDGWIVVASNGGRPEDPAWLRNVAADPDVEVQDGRRRVRARAAVASPERRAELWPRLKDHYAGWDHYQTLTDRVIQVVELRPTGERP
jgi:deazaflavin-dependent oxidoreductase (nitroreductase family)